MSDTFCAIIPAAGTGERIKGDKKKQFINIGGKPVIYYSLKAFCEANVKKIILVSPADDMDICREIIDKYSFSNVTVVAGGTTRPESVYNGLKNACEEYCLIHDGARPFIDAALIERCMEGVLKYDACIAAMPVRDTIKICHEKKTDGMTDDVIKSTPERSLLMAAQTPQAFRTSLIKDAYERAFKSGDIKNVTDDASLLEAEGKSVFIVEGSYRNIKITHPVDLIFAKGLLEI